MKCPKCDGKGFTELEHGLIMLECDECGGTGEIPDDNGSDLSKPLNGSDLTKPPNGTGEISDVSSNRIGLPDTDIRSTNPSKSKQHKKRKIKKKPRKRAD